jgi:peptide/nickel transport system permease protein
VLSYVGRRALYSIPVILVASFITFTLVRATFDPTAKLRQSHTAQQAIRDERARLGLDRPLVEQYGSWLGKFVHGDWGTSERTHEAVSAQIGRALWNTTQLVVWGVLLAALVAIAIGVYSALRQYSALDYTFTGLTFLGLALPPFWFGLILIEFLAVGPKQWFHLQHPPLFFIGLHSGSGGFDLDSATSSSPSSPSPSGSSPGGAASNGPRCSTSCRPTTSAPPAPKASRAAGSCSATGSATRSSRSSPSSPSTPAPSSAG